MRGAVVTVAGAGPAGALTAARLGAAGFRVLVFDPRAPWEKPCGGMLSPGSLERHPALKGYPYSVSARGGLVFESRGGERAHTVSRQPIPLVSRKDLGRFLLDAAVSAGAEFHPRRVRSVSRQRAGWRIETDGGSHEADLLVGADGVTGVVRRTILGRFPREHLGLACGYLLEGLPEKECVIKLLDIEGYLWVFPRQEQASVGIGTALGALPGRELFGRLDRFLAERYGRVRARRRFAALVPLAADADFFLRPACGRDWLLVGDAAGHVDPLLGEGLSYALQSAELAARAVGSGDPASYDLLWREAYGRELQERASLRREMSSLARLLGNAMVGEMLFRALSSHRDASRQEAGGEALTRR